MEGACSCNNGGRMVMSQNGGKNGHVTEISSLMEGEWSLRRWPV